MSEIRFTKNGDYDPQNYDSYISNYSLRGGITIYQQGQFFVRTTGDGNYSPENTPIRNGLNQLVYDYDSLYVDGRGAYFLFATGTNNHDVFIGSAFKDQLNGSGGDDTLTGNEGDDLLIGGAGADTLDGGDGIDTASYETSGAVTVNLADPSLNTGDALGDTYVSIENLRGSAGDDTLTGDAGDNVLEGGAGADTLDGGAGFNT